MNICLTCCEYLFLSLLGQISVFTKRNPVILWVSAVIFCIISIKLQIISCLPLGELYVGIKRNWHTKSEYLIQMLYLSS